jgi:hypothetical protein
VASMKVTVVWDVALCSLREMDGCFSETAIIGLSHRNVC